MRALVIEDDPHLRGLVSQYFADEGFAVDVAGDGENGLYMAEEYPVDIAIVDLGLPVTMHDVDVALRAAFEDVFGSLEPALPEAAAD